MTHESLALLVVGGVVGLGTMLGVAIRMLRTALRDLRELRRVGKVLGGLVYQEEEKTRVLIRDLGGRL